MGTITETEGRRGGDQVSGVEIGFPAALDTDNGFMRSGPVRASSQEFCRCARSCCGVSRVVCNSGTSSVFLNTSEKRLSPEFRAVAGLSAHYEWRMIGLEVGGRQETPIGLAELHRHQNALNCIDCSDWNDRKSVVDGFGCLTVGCERC